LNPFSVLGRPRRAPGWRVEEAELVAQRIGGAPPASELDLLSSRLMDRQALIKVRKISLAGCVLNAGTLVRQQRRSPSLVRNVPCLVQ
jgi:hypothetical protein